MGSRSTRKKKKAAAKKAAVNVQVQATKAAEAEVKAEKEVKAAEAKAAEKMEAAAEVKAADTEIRAENEAEAADIEVKAGKEAPAAEAKTENEAEAADTEVKAGKEAEAADTEVKAGKEAEAADTEVRVEKEAEVEASEPESESKPEVEASEPEVKTSEPEVKTSEQIPASETAEPDPGPEATDADTQDRNRRDPAFVRRFERHFDELKWLYIELYENDSMFAELCDNIHRFYEERNKDLKKLDREREEDPNWYKNNDMLGMMLYIDNFAGNMKGVQEKLDYLEKCNVNYIHLMPFLDTVEGRSDGGYAVADFRKVQERLGTMEDLESLTAACHKKQMNVCMDFVMNHTSEDHEWAKRARQGDGEYMSRYFFFNNDTIPKMYEQTVPQVFPTTAPGNFTWLPDAGHFVMTSFYPYQWDLNYRNPRVFNEMMYNFLYLANKGIDIIRIDAVPYIWKELGTQCRNLKQVHTIVRMMRIISEIVCPSVLLLGEVVMEPEKVVPYFGTVEKPECHMLYNVTTMATTWHTVATRDVSLLKKQLDIVNGLPKEYVFLNYLRCHDDIGWGLD